MLPSGPLDRVDHLIYAAPDVDRSVEELAERLGVRAAVGGRHLDHGTRNCLLSIGPRAYLEIVGPDREQPEPAKPRWFGIDGLTAARFATWAAGSADIDADVARAAAAGVRIGPVAAGGRVRDDGTEIRWRVSSVRAMLGDGLVPFLIDWGASPHPSESSPAGVRLVALRAEHPDPATLHAPLDALGIDLPASVAPALALIATFETPLGLVEIR